MKRYLLIAVAGLALAVLAGCGEDPGPRLEQLTTEYWDAVLNSRMHEAYGLLSESSQARLSPAEFSRAMRLLPAFCQGDGDVGKAFARKARMSIIGIQAKKKKATVSVILLLPSVAKLADDLKAKIPSTEPEPLDTTAWLSKQIARALDEGMVPVQEIRIKMSWIKENSQWFLDFSEETK